MAFNAANAQHEFWAAPTHRIVLWPGPDPIKLPVIARRIDLDKSMVGKSFTNEILLLNVTAKRLYIYDCHWSNCFIEIFREDTPGGGLTILDCSFDGGGGLSFSTNRLEAL